MLQTTDQIKLPQLVILLIKNPGIEQSPPANIHEKGKVTAVVAVAKYGPVNHHKSSKKAAKEKLIQVLLDSGSDGDQKGETYTLPLLD
jgi:hypothetical protein